MNRKKGLSPVVATVILVACAITLAIAIAWFMGTISGRYTRFPDENNDTDIIIDVNFTDANWTITYDVRFNCTIYTDDEGDGWALFNNGTHILRRKIKLSGDWMVIGGS